MLNFLWSRHVLFYCRPQYLIFLLRLPEVFSKNVQLKATVSNNQICRYKNFFGMVLPSILSTNKSTAVSPINSVCTFTVDKDG